MEEKNAQMTNNLPQGWVECELKDIFETASGGTPKRGISLYYDGNIPWLKSGELNNGIISTAEEYITEEGLKNSSAKLFPKGSLLIALYGATVGKLGILGFNSATNQAICCIYQNKNYCHCFLFYYLFFKKQYLINKGKGGAQPNISQEIIKTLPIPVPPFNEQKRIVAKIEEEFEKIDKGLEKLKLAKEQIKQYKQSVLKSAFKRNSYELNTWKLVQIEDVISKDRYSIKRGPFGSSLKKEFFQSSGIRVFEQYNPIHNDPHWSRYYVSDEKYKELESFTAQAGDLLISCSGTLGKIIELPLGTEKGIINQALLKITLNKKIILNSFFLYLFSSPLIQEKILDNTIGTAIQNIASVKKLKKITFFLPSILEQQKIVEEIEKRFAVADNVLEIVEENLKNAEQLKQSILKKAFEGKLVPQDPNDEPASVLLERIKSEREKNERI